MSEQPRRRSRRLGSRPAPAQVGPEPTWPPDPHWGIDDRGRFRYVDYDGESLHVWRDKDGALWIDKRGEGPVFIRQEDIPVILEAVEGK